MHYLILLYGDEAGATEPGTPEFDAEMAGYEAFGELAAEAIRVGRRSSSWTRLATCATTATRSW